MEMNHVLVVEDDKEIQGRRGDISEKYRRMKYFRRLMVQKDWML